MSSIEELFDCSDARLQDSGAQRHLSDKFWQDLEKAKKCLDEHRLNSNSNPANHDQRVKIAVLDSGIDLNRPETKDLIQKSPKWNPDRVTSKSFVGLHESSDLLGHGTHVACTIMSIAQGAKLYVGGVVGRDKKVDPEALADAIDFAVKDWEVDIISLSLGFPRSPTRKLEKSIKEALYREKLIFAAVSNGGGASTTGISWPAMVTKVFGVFSCNFNGDNSTFNPDEDDDRFSRFKFLGEAVKSAPHGERRMTGTSAATSIATSTAALFIEYIRLNMQGNGAVTRAGMNAIERCARMPDGMQRLFALAGKTRTAGAWLMHVYPWFLLDFDKRHDIICRIDWSLHGLQCENCNEDIQILEECNASIRGSLSDQGERLEENQRLFETAKSVIRTHVLGLMGFTAVGTGAFNIAFPLAHWLTNAAALGVIWMLLSSARENQSNALADYKLRATALREEILEASRLSSQNIARGDEIMSELLSLIERILEKYAASNSNTEVPEAELGRLGTEVAQLSLHPRQQTEIQSTETVSLDARVQFLLDELEKSIGLRSGDDKDSRDKAKETLEQAKRVVKDSHDVSKELDKIKKKIDAQEEQANVDLAAKEERERGNTLQWLHWFLIWLGIGGAVLVMIMAAFTV